MKAPDSSTATNDDGSRGTMGSAASSSERKASARRSTSAAAGTAVDETCSSAGSVLAALAGVGATGAEEGGVPSAVGRRRPVPPVRGQC